MSLQPDIIFVKVGALENSYGVVPQFQLWTVSKQIWAEIASVPGMAGNP